VVEDEKQYDNNMGMEARSGMHNVDEDQYEEDKESFIESQNNINDYVKSEMERFD
jgi:hypothetical protein